MMSSDPDPAVRWRAIVAFYTEFAAESHWEYLQPMEIMGPGRLLSMTYRDECVFVPDRRMRW